MTLPISYFRFYFPEYELKTRLPPNCATGFLDSLEGPCRAWPLFLERKKKKNEKRFAAGGEGRASGCFVPEDGLIITGHSENNLKKPKIFYEYSVSVSRIL